jgi:hypothetical protein
MHLSEQRPARINSRRQYSDLENQRSTLAARLNGLGGQVRAHPGHKRALVLINDIFRKSALSKRREILDAADWLIGLLEQLTAPGQAASDFAVRKIRRVLPPGTKSLPSSPVRGTLPRAP